MEWTELILKYFVQIIHYIAWPAVALVSLFFFRKKLGLLIDRIIKVAHGNSSIEFSNTGEQGGSSELSISESALETKGPVELPPEAKKILATLWQRQKYHFKDDFTGRWSFRVLPGAEGYGNFMLGFADLLKLGLVGWTPKNGQVLLTDKGIEYLKRHNEIQVSDKVYTF